VTLKM